MFKTKSLKLERGEKSATQFRAIINFSFCTNSPMDCKYIQTFDLHKLISIQCWADNSFV